MPFHALWNVVFFAISLVCSMYDSVHSRQTVPLGCELVEH
jgi:hypothetical protein